MLNIKMTEEELASWAALDAAHEAKMVEYGRAGRELDYARSALNNVKITRENLIIKAILRSTGLDDFSYTIDDGRIEVTMRNQDAIDEMTQAIAAAHLSDGSHPLEDQ